MIGSGFICATLFVIGGTITRFMSRIFCCVFRFVCYWISDFMVSDKVASKIDAAGTCGKFVFGTIVETAWA